MNQGAEILELLAFRGRLVSVLFCLLSPKAIARVRGTIHNVRDSFTAIAVWSASLP
jgi:hypothetical protein